MPKEIFGSETGYAHTNGLRKRPYNPVRQALRTTVAIHGDHPCVLIADDIRKDDDEHLYEWFMQIPTDLTMESHVGRDVILADPDGDRKLLVKVLRTEFGSLPTRADARVEDYLVAEDKKRGTKTRGKRLIIAQKTVASHFRILLFPFRTGTPLPGVVISEGGEDAYSITLGPSSRMLTLEPDDVRGMKVGVR